MTLSERSVLSAREAAARCGVDERTVRRWIASGRLRADRRGGSFRVAVSALAPFLAERADTADTPAAARRTDGPDGRTAAAERTDTAAATDQAPLVAHLEAEVLFLRGELAARQHQLEQDAQERAELRRLLALALQRPALPAPSEAPDLSTLKESRPWWARWRAWWRR